MALYPVYPLWEIEADHAQGCVITDTKGQEYLDFYGGHAVISIGHSHPVYVQALNRQLSKIGFYSNSIRNGLQETLSERLASMGGYPGYRLFLCNSGAEANENAVKLASFQTGRDRVLAFKKAFHGRTSGSVALTDNPKIVAPFNAHHAVDFIPMDDFGALEKAFSEHSYAAAIIEGIQGVSGIHEASTSFFRKLRELCTTHDTCLILDEVQSGYGRTGRFFAHQHHGITADLITMAKGMGNGFPIGGVLISPEFKASFGQLGTTFGGNHLACTAALAVLQVMEDEKLMDNALQVGSYLIERLKGIKKGIKEVRGRGLMIGVELHPEFPANAGLRDRLLFEHHIFTGAAGPNVLRLLPPLCLSRQQADLLISLLE